MNVLTFPLIVKGTPIKLIDDAAVATLPSRIAIEVQTSLGLGVLEMSRDAAEELAVALLTHLQARDSRLGVAPSAPAKGR
jgi:hypothetical protein